MKFSEIDGDCENKCPLYEEFCDGGLSNCNGECLEPPCVSLDYDDADELYDSMKNSESNREIREDAIIEKEQIKAKKREIRKQKLFAYRIRNHKELSKIKEIKKRMHATKKLSSLISSFSSAVNFTNEMFKASGFSCPEDIKPKNNHDKEIDNYEKEIATLQQTIKNNEKLHKLNKPKQG